jgi:hypothetical protein
MALAIDSVMTGTAQASASPLTLSFTNTAGTLVVVGVNIAQVNPEQLPTINSVTWAGATMTLVDSHSGGAPILSADCQTVAFYYLNAAVNGGTPPATGTNNVSVAFTYSGSPGATNANTHCGAMSFTGADPTTPFGTALKQKETSTGTSTGATLTLSSTTSGNYGIAITDTGSGGLAVTSPATAVYVLNASIHSGGDNSAMAYRVSSGGSLSIAFTFTTDIYVALAVEVLATGTGGGPTPQAPFSNLKLTGPRPADFKPMGDAFRTAKFGGWR